MTTAQAILADLIRENRPGCVGVEFDEDGQHVYIAMRASRVARRYRLGQDAQRFVSGEFPLDEFDDDVLVRLEPPHSTLRSDYIQRFPTPAGTGAVTRAEPGWANATDEELKAEAERRARENV